MPQIIKVLGDRPFELKQSVKDYLSEITTREQKEQETDKKEAPEETTEDESKTEQNDEQKPKE